MNRSISMPLLNMPDAGRFAALADRMFSSGMLTNNGDLARELESRLAAYLGVDYLVLTSSGTLALQVAYRALNLTGEVITTPFSWTTTVSSLCWLGLRPRFADIDPQSYNLDPARIEAQVTPATSAILGVHTFGNPCDIDAIDAIASRHGLRTVYDAAHAFGTRHRQKSVVEYGDASVLSLHATKLFHTVEGGAVILREREHYKRARSIVNNGIDPDGEVRSIGVNGRLSELHAAVGLCLLDNIDDVLRRRVELARALRVQLREFSAVELQGLNPAADVNHAYFPLVFPTREMREDAMYELARAGFAARRYFDHPLNRLPFLEEGATMPVAELLCQRILCLPMRAEASFEEIEAMRRIVADICPRERESSLRRRT